jgi:hypothetical protein
MVGVGTNSHHTDEKASEISAHSQVHQENYSEEDQGEVDRLYGQEVEEDEQGVCVCAFGVEEKLSGESKK